MSISGDSGSPGKQPRRTHPYPPRKLTEEDIVGRLELLFNAIAVPDDFRCLILEILCPDSSTVPPLPAGPTDAMPGTEDKVRVMAERAERGECIFHPDDPVWEGKGDTIDRLFQMARNHANGASARLQQPLLRVAAGGSHEEAPARKTHAAPRPPRRPGKPASRRRQPPRLVQQLLF